MPPSPSSHPPSTAHDFTEANRTFFNTLAQTYDIAPWQQKAALQATTAIQDNLAFIRIPPPTPTTTTTSSENENAAAMKTTTLLDYASGTGMISRALGPYVDSIKAIDLSSEMVGRYNALAATSEIEAVRVARAGVGDLLRGGPAELENEHADAEGEGGGGDDEDGGKGEGLEVGFEGSDFYDFSVVAVGLGVHHFHDPGEAIARLARRVRKGGVLLIVDFVEEENGEGGGERQRWVASEADKTIRKRGFSEGEMRGLILREGNGLGEFGWRVVPERVEIRMKENNPIHRLLFLARATKMS